MSAKVSVMLVAKDWPREGFGLSVFHELRDEGCLEPSSARVFFPMTNLAANMSPRGRYLSAFSGASKRYPTPWTV